MKYTEPNSFVIVQERSNGNATIGDMWHDTHTFSPTTTLAEVWRRVAPYGNTAGRTMIRPDESSGSTDIEE
jgi:hypothetical protein